MVLASLVAAALVVAAPAPPAAPTDQTELFKRLFAKGEALFQRGDYVAAIWNFRRADRLKVTPEVAYDLAKCHEKLGDPAYATYYYRLYLRRAPAATDALIVAEKVGTVLSQAGTSGRGLLEVESSSPGPATVKGRKFNEFPIAVLLPPGDYELSAPFPDGVQKKQVSIRTGKVTAVSVEPLPPVVVAAAPEPSPPPPPTLLPAEPPSTPSPLEVTAAPERQGLSTLRWAAYASLGASAAALLGGVAVGLLARQDASRLTSQHGGLTYAQAQGLADGANRKGHLANLLFAVGGGAGLAGGGLYLFSAGDAR